MTHVNYEDDEYHECGISEKKKRDKKRKEKREEEWYVLCFLVCLFGAYKRFWGQQKGGYILHPSQISVHSHQVPIHHYS